MALERGGWAQPLVFAAAAAALAAGGMLLAYSAGPVFLLVALGALGIAALAVANPLTAVLVAITLIPLELVSLAVGGNAGISPAEGVFALAGFGWVARRIMAGLPPYVDSPLTKPLAVLLLIAVVGLGASENAGETLRIIVMWTAAFFVVQLVVDEAKPSTVGWILLLLAVTGGIVGLITGVTSGGQEQQLVGMGAEATGRGRGVVRASEPARGVPGHSARGGRGGDGRRTPAVPAGRRRGLRGGAGGSRAHALARRAAGPGAAVA